MTITIKTSTSYNVNINLGEPGARFRTCISEPYSPSILSVLPNFSPFGTRGGLSSDHTWALHPVNHAIYTQPPNLLQSQERFARGINTSLSVRKTLSIQAPQLVLSSCLTRSVSGYSWLAHQLLVRLCTIPL